MSRTVMSIIAILVASTAGLVTYCDGQIGSAGSLSAASAQPKRSAPRSAIKPPVARIIANVFNEYGNRRVDNYYWLRERDNPNVISYLKAENAYADARLKPIQPLASKLYAEMAARHDAADESVPYLDDGYYYQTRYAKGAEYPVSKGTLNAPMQVVLDVSNLAAGYPQFNLNNWIVSADGSLVAYAVDTSGDLTNQIFVKTIATGKIVDQSVRKAADDLVFIQHGNAFLYVRLEPETGPPPEKWSDLNYVF